MINYRLSGANNGVTTAVDAHQLGDAYAGVAALADKVGSGRVTNTGGAAAAGLAAVLARGHAVFAFEGVAEGEFGAVPGADAARGGWTFHTVGGIDRAFENAVMDHELRFWMHGNQAGCATLPPLNASDQKLYQHFDSVPGFEFFTDQMLTPFVGAFYQSVETGWPTLTFPHLRPLLRHEYSYQPRTYVPPEIPMTRDQRVVRDVDHWVRHHGTRLMFVNGGNDPAVAEPFRLGPGSSDAAVYVAPGVNHDIFGDMIAKLPPRQKAKATADLRRWAR